VELPVIDGIDDFYWGTAVRFLANSAVQKIVSPDGPAAPVHHALLHGGHLDEQPLTSCCHMR